MGAARQKSKEILAYRSRAAPGRVKGAQTKGERFAGKSWGGIPRLETEAWRRPYKLKTKEIVRGGPAQDLLTKRGC